jgi:hypothetical protein
MQSLSFHNNNFKILPDEIVLMMADMLSPTDLYNFMMISKYHYNLIKSNVKHFVNLFSRTSKFKVEQFMWSQFNNPNFNKYNRSDIIIFQNMIDVYYFANSNILEKIWEQNNLDNSEAGPLPENKDKLYIFKFQVGMLYKFHFGWFSPDNVVKRANEYLSSVLNSYTHNDNVFRTMFLFIIKYGDEYTHIYELLETNYEKLALKGHTFEIIDKYTKESFDIISNSELNDDENYDYEEDEDDDPNYGLYVLNKMLKYEKYVNMYYLYISELN